MVTFDEHTILWLVAERAITLDLGTRYIRERREYEKRPDILRAAVVVFGLGFVLSAVPVLKTRTPLILLLAIVGAALIEAYDWWAKRKMFKITHAQVHAAWKHMKVREGVVVQLLPS